MGGKEDVVFDSAIRSSYTIPQKFGASPTNSTPSLYASLGSRSPTHTTRQGVVAEVSSFWIVRSVPPSYGIADNTSAPCRLITAVSAFTDGPPVALRVTGIRARTRRLRRSAIPPLSGVERSTSGRLTPEDAPPCTENEALCTETRDNSWARAVVRPRPFEAAVGEASVLQATVKDKRARLEAEEIVIE